MLTIQKKNLVIIIVNYCSSPEIKNFLSSYKSPKKIQTRFVIVDSFYSDYEFKKLYKVVNENSQLDIDLLKSNKNIGYAGGNNKAYNFILKNNIKGNILIINPDIKINSSSIEKLYETLKNKIVIASPRTFNDSNLHLYDTVKLNGFITEYKNILKNGIYETDYSPGSCLMISRFFLENYNFKELFKSEYFMYWEEVDLCLKIRELKFKCVCNNTSFAYRKNNPPTASISQTYFMLKNSFRIKKYYPNNFNKVDHIMYVIRFFLISIKYSYKLKNIKILNSFYKGLIDGFKL